jgi:PadR family transcriptional regulator PadR
MDTQLKRGLLEICVLKVLTKGDSYGYQLIKDISFIIEITESTLYPILKRLENSNLLNVYNVEHGGRLRKYYKITNEGRNRIIEFLEEWEAVMKVYHFIEEDENEKE